MTITTHPAMPSLWIVTAEWMGAQRTVHEGDIWSCITFTADHA